MHLHRNFLFLVLLLCVNPSQSILGWDAISFLSNALHDGFASETPSEKIYSRHKRDVGASASEYTVDIEISFPNASLLNSVRNYIKELKYPIMLNASDSINITSITLTTACEQIGSSLQCTCERGYTWPTNVCATYNSCAASLQSCGCITQLPPLGSYCQLQPVQTKLILRLDMEFNSSFTNPSSPVYIKVKGDLEKAFTENYKSLPGFQKAYVTAFRQGSVIADYTIVTGPTTETELNSASTLVAQSLSATYKLSDPPIQTVIEGYGTISISPSYIFDGDTASLECVMNISAANVTWDINGTKPFTNDSKHIIITQVEKSGSKSILNITAIKAADNGTYNCKMSEGPNLYVASTNVNIYTLNITVLNTTVICDGSEVPIVQCCTEGIDNKFSLTCSMSGSPSIVGVSRSFTNCWTYSVNPSADQCSGAADGLKVTYNYYCSTGNGAVRNQVVNVTFSVKRQLKILPEGNPYNISEGKLISLNCVSNGNIDGVTWEFSSGSINQSIDQKLYTKVASNVSLLSIPSATSNWQGNFHCKLSSDAQATASKIVQVYKLIQSSQIIVNPIKSFFTCGNITLFQCCVDDTTGYTATFNVNGKDQPVSSNSNTCFSLNYQLSSVCTPVMTNIVAFCNIVNLLNDNVRSSNMSVTEILVSDKNCENPTGAEGSNINISCDANQIGFKIKYCNEKKWIENVSASSCSSAALNRLSIETRDLSSPGANERIPYILGNLSDTVTNQTENITNSAENIKLVVSILTTIENAAKTVANSVMEDILESVSIIVDDKSTNTWNQVPDRIKESSLLLQSVERFARKLIIVNGEINITTSNVILKGITKSDTTSNYAEQFNFTQTNYLTGDVSIDKEHLDKIEANSSIVSIAYATLKDILQSTENASGNATVNGLIMTTTIGNISRENFQISMTFKKSNISLNKGDCVFWNFSLNNWDKTGCTAKLSSEFVECSCNHLTSFSILMSSSEIDDQVLDLITYIGVGISILSLIICIIIEGTVWKSVTKNKTSYMRHVCLVNIAVSLLIADIWFIVGSGVRPTLLNKISGEYDTPSNACVAATFFSHLFYLSVFFWMLTMGLILFYRLVYVLHDMSKTIMMSISFVMGYICPLVIAAITVAVTMSKPNQTYTAKRFCWLNTSESNAFIAFVVPALTILLINFIILAVVIVKLLRPTIGDKPRKDERNTLVQVTKSIAILTPLLGLTWGFGLGTVWIDSPKWIHGIFAALNSLQGLFILLFGCLLDKKVRDALFNTFSLSRWSSQQTKTTNASSSSEPPFSKTVFNLFGKKGAYNISSAQMSSSSDLGSNSYSLLN